MRTRTGPGSGAFITDVDADHASAMLASHFFFKELSITDIYALRIVLEPLLARQVAEHISEAEVSELERRMSAYREPPKSIEEERTQRTAELEFHAYLTSLSPNLLLSFLCAFLVRMLRDLTVCQKIYERPNPQLRESGLSYQEQLINALRRRDGQEAARVLEAHMRHAEQVMLAQEARLEHAFL